MGLLKFRFPTPWPETRLADLRKSYVTGLDRTPSRLNVEIRKDLLICQRSTTESGRLFAPWPVDRFGTPFTGTATLGERPEPYSLAIELARGKLNDVRNQLADWKQMGLRVPTELDDQVAESLRSFFKAATTRDFPTAALESSQRSLATAFAAGQALVDVYVDQVLRNRMVAGKLSTHLAIGLDGDPGPAPWASKVVPACNAAHLSVTWKSLAPTEGKLRWDEFDAQLAWANKHKLAVQTGPIIDLRPGALPDWIWLWEGDFDAILGMAVDVVRQTVARSKGKVPLWTLIHRPGSTRSPARPTPPRSSWLGWTAPGGSGWPVPASNSARSTSATTSPAPNSGWPGSPSKSPLVSRIPAVQSATSSNFPDSSTCSPS